MSSNVVLERNARLLERITEFDSQERATLTPLEFPAETWIYNGTWEEAWENEDDEVKQKFSKPEE